MQHSCAGKAFLGFLKMFLVRGVDRSVKFLLSLRMRRAAVFQAVFMLFVFYEPVLSGAPERGHMGTY
jgi:hypothetical protein